MNLTRYVNDLQQQLAVAARAGGEEASALADRLLAPLETTVRLVLLEALSDAAAEITSELAPGSVEVRLRGRDPEFAVTQPPATAPRTDDGVDEAGRDGVVPAQGPDAEGTAARTTLRLPEQLKVRAEGAAAREGISVNTWLVRAAAAALESGAGQPGRRGPSMGQQFTGWVK